MEFWEKKYNHIFRYWDHNRDGYITLDDIKRMEELWVSVADDDDVGNRQIVLTSFQKLQEIVLGQHKNKAGVKITKDEFVRLVTSPGVFQDTLMCAGEALLRSMDQDRNGSLSLEEYTKLYIKVGIPAEIAVESFRKLDRDGSGEISFAECQIALNEMYLSHDPEAPGNWMLGPMDLS